MNDFGIRQFPPQYGPIPPLPPPPQHRPPQETGSSKPFLLLLLIITCLVLGVLLAWGMREHGERARLTARNHDVEDAYVFVMAKQSNLASFLTDPRTRLYRLPARRTAGAGLVTIAWQEDSRSGLLIGDRIPLPGDHEHYAIWQVDSAGKTEHGADFRPDSGGTYCEFHLTGPADATAGFRITLQGDSGNERPGDVVYETRP